MKKLLAMLMVCTLPILALTGCGESPLLNKFATSKNGPDFLCMVSDKLSTFKTNIQNKMTAPVQQPEGEGEEETTPTFDFSALSGDEAASSVWQDKVWEVVDKANTENMFAMMAYNIYEKNQDFAYADLSFMSTTESEILKDFYIEKTNSVNGTSTYISHLSGLEAPSLNLPVPHASKPELVDRADDVIKQLGNYLEFTVSKRDISTEIKIDAGFVMPTEQDVQKARAGTDILYQMMVESNQVVIIYDHENQTYTKLVTFTVQPNGEVKKFVKKLDGDATQTGNLTGGIDYEYTLKPAENAKYDICCDYTITYSAGDGGVFCQQKRENNAYTWAEYYLVETAELVGRIKQNNVSHRTTIDLLLNQDLISGSIKYNFQRSSISKNTTAFLRDEQVLRKDFTLFTQDEIAVAKSNSALNAQILAYVISEDKLRVDYASNS
ncbi:MAG: hypothetical protein IJF22_02670 [Clostridia bacterium]|nr:hypothetical protein [Clostridia bacterium]